MLAICLKTFLICNVVAASQSRQSRQEEISPKTYSITNEDIRINVDDSATMAHLRCETKKVGGTYTKITSDGTTEEQLFFRQMEQENALLWTMMGQWKRHPAPARYLLVFNQKRQDATKPQKWIIASFKESGAGAIEIERFAPLDGFVKLSRTIPETISDYSEDMRAEIEADIEMVEFDLASSDGVNEPYGKHYEPHSEPHASSSARKSDSEKSPRSMEQAFGIPIPSPKHSPIQSPVHSTFGSVIEIGDHHVESRSAPPQSRDERRMREMSCLEWMNDELEAVKRNLGEELKQKTSEIDRMEQQIQGLQEEKVRDDAAHEESEKEHDQVTERLTAQLEELKEQISQLTERERKQSNETMIILCSAGAVLAVVLIFCAVSHYKVRSAASRKMRKALRDQREKTLKANEPLPLMPSHADRLGVHEHPAVRDQFGMKEVFSMTAGEGKDLVRIARPLETAGAERNLSEELMNIQPIIADSEGVRDTIPEDISYDVSNEQTSHPESKSLEATQQHRGSDLTILIAHKL